MVSGVAAVVDVRLRSFKRLVTLDNKSGTVELVTLLRSCVTVPLVPSRDWSSPPSPLKSPPSRSSELLPLSLPLPVSQLQLQSPHATPPQPPQVDGAAVVVVVAAVIAGTAAAVVTTCAYKVHCELGRG